MELTQEYLKECLDYNPETGVFTWKVRPLSHFKNKSIMKTINTRQSGKNVKGLHLAGYGIARINRKGYLLHRLAWLYVHGVMPENQIDHINGIRTDNRIVNLRLAVNAENCQNKRIAQSNNKSTGLLGASWCSAMKKYKARITKNGNEKTIGYFNTPEEAHEAYIKAKRELHEFNTL